jgi:DNA-binding protein HU-beta
MAAILLESSSPSHWAPIRVCKNAPLAAQPTFHPLPNHFFHSAVQSELFRRGTIMALPGKATKPTAAAKTSRPVTLKHLAAVLAEEHQLTKRAGEAILGDLVGIITKHLKKGERVRIAGLGILQVRKRAARMGRNPATGETIKIKASKKVAFRAAKDLKMAV